MLNLSDTIFAQATAPGRSGVAIIRISGVQAMQALPVFGFKDVPTARMAHFHSFRVADELIDQGLILAFPAPHSFTGEDILEFQLHGGAAILKRMLAELSKLPNFRPAEAGEFARRAFLNGKMDLTAAEGLVDLIDAETEAQRKQATQLVQGKAARFYDGLRERIITPLAHLEAYIDFPEEDIPESVYSDIRGKVDALCADITGYLEEDNIGEKIRQGFVVVLLGAPNAGKSSLLNALVKREAAIVSQQAGTTRDLIEIQMDMGGLPVILVDTAGLREIDESIEAEGIRRAKQRAEQADLKLVLLAQDAPLDEESAALIGAQTMVLHTKSDLAASDGAARSAVGYDSFPAALAECSVSAQTGAGVAELLEKIHAHLAQQIPQNHHGVIVRERYRHHLREAYDELTLFAEETALELQCERLRLAAVELSRITGTIDIEDLLDVIFSSFCIGK